MEKDNEDQKLIKPEWIRRAKTMIEEGDLKERIKRVQKGDERVVKAVEELKRVGIKTLKDEEWGNKGWNSNERREDIHTRRGTQGGNNMIAL